MMEINQEAEYKSYFENIYTFKKYLLLQDFWQVADCLGACMDKTACNNTLFGPKLDPKQSIIVC